jgi:hypothetical protein
MRPRFYDLVMRYSFGLHVLQEIGEQAGVSNVVMNSLFLGDPVAQADAEKVLAIISERTNQTYTLDNTTIPLKGEVTRPFFAELWRRHHFRVDIVAPLANVSEEVVHAMLRYEPVSKADASAVLATLSTVLKQEYTLETVQVRLEDES